MPTPNTAEKHEFDFTVVDGRSGKPIADAEVSWFREADDGSGEFYEVEHLMRWDEMMEPDLGALESRTRASGFVSRSDADGRVVLPGKDWPSVFARKGTLLGGTESLWSDDKDDHPKLHLWPDGDIRVRVVDASDHALANTDVLLIHGDVNYLYASECQRATTDAEGMATLRHACVSIASATARNSETKQAWRVEVEMIPARVACQVLDSAALSHQAITLRMPPTGDVQISLRELDGSPARIDLPAVLEEVDADNSPVNASDEKYPRFEFTPKPRELRATLVNGKAIFHDIGLGRNLVAFAARNGASHMNVMRFAGPEKIGERVQTTMVLGPESVILSGRALGPEGSALADARLRVELFGGPSPEREPFRNFVWNEPVIFVGGSLVTNSQGQFTVEFAMNAAFDGRPILVLGHKRRAQSRSGLASI